MAVCNARSHQDSPCFGHTPAVKGWSCLWPPVRLFRLPISQSLALLRHPRLELEAADQVAPPCQKWPCCELHCGLQTRMQGGGAWGNSVFSRVSTENLEASPWSFPRHTFTTVWLPDKLSLRLSTATSPQRPLSSSPDLQASASLADLATVSRSVSCRRKHQN